MTIGTVSRVIARIKIAPPSNPIAVFVVEKDGRRRLDAIYENTSEAKKRQTALKPFHPSDKCQLCGHISQTFAEEYLGAFDNTMSLVSARAFFHKALES
jgi:hypothetical protein